SAARTCERVGVPNKQALYLGMLAESLWTVGESGAAIAALEEGAQAASALTLSHAFILLQLGQLDDAVAWLEQFVGGEPDPQRRAVARLGLARAHAWSGRVADARAQCDEALAILEPTPVPRFVLPVRSMRNALDGKLDALVETLDAIESACAPYEFGEAVLDAGEALVEHDARGGLVARYLSIAGRAAHRGLRYRIEDLRATLFERIGDNEGARECVQRSHHELDRLLDRMNDEYRERMADHPWVKAIRRVRAVP
ncbi:MAG TPA: tetratricopeptide repeat protein, partial [Kofleriaceae bacterium]|nr:tetratricopeptide repeat protein [Kofleriaceae bacterium]